MLQTNKKHARMLKRTGLVFLVSLLLVAVYQTEAWAAKYSISIAKTTGAPAVILTMGNAVAGTTLSYDIKNLGTGGSVYKIAFTVPSGYTLDAAQAGDAPLNWNTATLSNGNRTMTFATAQNGGSTIPRNTTRTFILRLSSAAVPALNQDGTVALSSVVATYNNNRTATLNNPAGTTWSVRSLAIINITAVDSVTGLQSTTPGGSITVMLTVMNRSTGNWTGIISIPQPPTVAVVWNTGSTTVTTLSNPSITLNAGQTGNLVWTYAVGSACGGAGSPSGSVTFSVTGVRNSTNVATSVAAAVTSNSVAIGCFTGTISLNPTCLASGTNTTVTMTLNNGFAYNITGVTAPADPGFSGTATRTLVAPYPTYTSTNIASGGTATVTWVFTITGAVPPSKTYSFTGGAVNGTLQSAPVKAVTASITPSLIGTIVTPPIFPTPIATIPSDKNKMVDISWTFTNTLCNPVNQVAITVPAAGWTYLDGSAVITNAAVSYYDDWNVAMAGTVVTFTAGTSIIVGGSGTFTLFFSQTPTTTVPPSYVFPVVITDSVLGPQASIDTNVNIGPAGGAGMLPAGLWGEQVR